jgi:hypothetical protein
MGCANKKIIALSGTQGAFANTKKIIAVSLHKRLVCIYFELCDSGTMRICLVAERKSPRQ